MVAVMVGAIGGFSPIILKIWLGEEFVAYNSWLLLKLALVPFYSAAGVFSFVIRAWNKVRFSALVTVALGIINLVALYFLAKYADGDLRYVDVMLFVAVLMGIGQSYFLGGLYFSKLYKGTLSEVLYNFIKILLVFLLVGGVCYVINQYIINMQDVVALSIIGVVSLVLLIAALKTTLNKKQLDAIIALVYKN